VEGDPARLQQIFWNLIKNSVKFTPSGGTLTISTTNDSANKIRVEVRDTGAGIPPELLPKIFDAFEQGESARAGGLGLGLAITKAIVDMHGGSVSADSEGRGHGASFTVCLPAVPPITSEMDQKAAAARNERRALRVLFVEDHEDSNRSLTALLKRRGYDVYSAYDVASAVSAAENFPFDVLVSDMGLPDGTGNDLIAQLSQNRSVFGIALTGYGMENDIQESQSAGFRHHLIKPVDLNRLDELIQTGAA
jgi:CheY-like chemotaxis protein